MRLMGAQPSTDAFHYRKHGFREWYIPDGGFALDWFAWRKDTGKAYGRKPKEYGYFPIEETSYGMKLGEDERD